MKTPRRQPPRLSQEHLLLLGALSLFTTGAAWVGHASRTSCPKPSATWASLLPKLGLPLFNGLLPR